MYYGMRWHYGIAANEDGSRCAEYYSFDTRAARDAWVRNGPSYRSERGYRESVRASDRELRKALRYGNNIVGED